MIGPSTILAVVVAVTILASLVVVKLLDPAGDRWTNLLRDRLLLGVPWGTLVVVGFVLATYFVIQDGITNLDRPVVIPYRAWSYFYPLGMLTSGFSHASLNHLVGNMLATLVIGPLAEYAWGHYPPDRDDRLDGRWRTDPRVRAFVLFPGVVLFVGFVTGLFALGPVIGFSGVVFALAGFVIIRYPITTLVATIGVGTVVATVYRAITSPILEYEAQPRPPAPPGWAEIAIQGHALGLLLGVVVGIALFRHRGHRPGALRLWIALLAYGVAQALWAIYWFRGDDVYVLFRGPGVVIVAVVALLITVAATGPDRPLVDSISLPKLRSGTSPIDRIYQLGLTDDVDDRIRTLAGSARDAGASVRYLPSSQYAALLAVLAVLALVSGSAIPANLFVVEDDGAPEHGTVEIDDYTIFYDEDVRNEMIGAIDIGAFGETTNVTTSGVIVASPDRNIWTPVVSKQRLAFDGERHVVVGGPGWRSTVTVERQGWTPIGNDTVYQVWLDPDDGDRRLAFQSDPSTADVKIDGHTVTVSPAPGQFVIEVTDVETDSTVTTDIPEVNETTTAGDLEFEHSEGTIYASIGATEIPIIEAEEYN